jgi:hypothetical protein
MPLARIHVLEGQYDDARLGRVSSAVQNGLIRALGIPPEDFFQIIHVLPRSRFLHTPSFLGLTYSDDLILPINDRGLSGRNLPRRSPHHAVRDAGREHFLRPRPGSACPCLRPKVSSRRTLTARHDAGVRRLRSRKTEREKS